jgi:hypothetical protein
VAGGLSKTAYSIKSRTPVSLNRINHYLHCWTDLWPITVTSITELRRSKRQPNYSYTSSVIIRNAEKFASDPLYLSSWGSIRNFIFKVSLCYVHILMAMRFDISRDGGTSVIFDLNAPFKCWVATAGDSWTSSNFPQLLYISHQHPILNEIFITIHQKLRDHSHITTWYRVFFEIASRLIKK